MPVAIIQPNRKEEDDPLEKVANALNIARHGFGIYADMQGLEAAKVQREQEAKIKGLQAGAMEDERAGILSGKDRAVMMKDMVPAKEGERGAFILPSRQADGSVLNEYVKRYEPTKTQDPVARELALGRLEEQRRKAQEAQQPKKNEKEFSKRFKNINTQVENLKTLLDDKGTFEVFGDHEKKLQQALDSVAIDAAKLFDPESVARESEVAAFRNMLFQPGTLGTSNSTAKGLVENFQKIIQSRAENEGLAHLIDQNPEAPPVAGGQQKTAVPPDIQAAAAKKLAERRAQAKR